MGRKILVIEDDQSVALMLGTALRLAGYEVVTAPDAVVALSVARQERPDLILLDLGLPGGGGMVVLERLRGLMATAITPVIVISGNDVTEKEILEAGAQGFLAKPVTADKLVAAVASFLSAGRDFEIA